MALARWTSNNDAYVMNRGDSFVVYFPAYASSAMESTIAFMNICNMIPEEERTETDNAILEVLSRRMQMVDSEEYPIKELRDSSKSFNSSQEMLAFLEDIMIKYPLVKVDIEKIKEGVNRRERKS